MSTSTVKIGANMANDESKVSDTSETKTTGRTHVKIDELLKLQESTRKLLCVLEELQSKTLSKAIHTEDLPRLSNFLKPIELLREERTEVIKHQTINDVIGVDELKMLEYQARELDCLILEDEDDCTVYKKLTRKCNCLTRSEYNDFVIHFNEDTRYCTGVVGEIIKNIKIVKKFLYMGCCYTKSALMFLNEGLSSNERHEKRNILQAISFADLCCVFDETNIVSFCICWPCKHESSCAAIMQDFASTFLYKLAETEEGRRYINLNSRIACDIKKVLKKNTSKIELSVIDSLKSVLETCQIAAIQPSTLTYQCFPAEEELGNRMLSSLTAFRQYMSIGEVFACLEELLDTCNTPKGKDQLILQLPTILNLFKSMLLEYDDSSMNILMTNIMNRLMEKSPKDDEAPRRTKVVNIATEPVQMVDAPVQPIDKKKSFSKKNNNDKNRSLSKPYLTRQNAKGDHPVPPHREHDKDFKLNKTRALSRSRRFLRDPSIIVVPIDREK